MALTGWFRINPLGRSVRSDPIPDNEKDEISNYLRKQWGTPSRKNQSLRLPYLWVNLTKKSKKRNFSKSCISSVLKFPFGIPLAHYYFARLSPHPPRPAWPLLRFPSPALPRTVLLHPPSVQPLVNFQSCRRTRFSRNVTVRGLLPNDPQLPNRHPFYWRRMATIMCPSKSHWFYTAPLRICIHLLA